MLRAAACLDNCAGPCPWRGHDAPVKLSRALSNLISGGVTAETPGPQRKYLVLSNTLALLSLTLTLAHAPFFLAFWRPAMKVPTLLLGFGALGYVAVLVLIRAGRTWAGRVLLHFVSPLLIGSEGLLLGREVAAHWYMFLVFIAVLFTFSAAHNVARYVLVAFAAASFLALEVYLQIHGGLVVLSVFETHILGAAVRVGLLGGLIAFLGYVAANYDTAERSLERERQRSDLLLLNILPGPIAEALKAGQGTIAEAYRSASVLFADIVGFTPLSEQVEAHELVRRLNGLFSQFDELVAEHRVEKIKTIGDAYMVAAGVPIESTDHAARLVNFAVAMRRLAGTNRDFGEALRLRIGIHSGPVVAGVIGRMRFIYDLWGDTVNTAARMESHGLPDEIQISRATRDLLGEEFQTDLRGAIEIKGKGPMEVFLLRGQA